MTSLRLPSRSARLAVVVGVHAAVLWSVAQPHPPALATHNPHPLTVELIAPAPLPVTVPPESPSAPVKPSRTERTEKSRPRPVQHPLLPTPDDTPRPQAIADPMPAATVIVPESGPVQSAATSPGPAGTPAPTPITPARFDAAYLQNPAPPYPPLARRMGEQGTVLLRVFVSPEGLAQSVDLKRGSGSPRLDHAALDTVQRWRFVPARQGETPVGAWVIVPIVFNLEG